RLLAAVDDHPTCRYTCKVDDQQGEEQPSGHRAGNRPCLRRRGARDLEPGCAAHRLASRRAAMPFKASALLALLLASGAAAAPPKVVQNDYQIDSVDPGIRLHVRSKMAAGQKEFTDDNIVLFVHGATFPSTPDFDLQFKDYSWADWMVSHGYVVYMFDKR